MKRMRKNSTPEIFERELCAETCGPLNTLEDLMRVLFWTILFCMWNTFKKLQFVVNTAVWFTV